MSTFFFNIKNFYTFKRRVDTVFMEVDAAGDVNLIVSNDSNESSVDDALWGSGVIKFISRFISNWRIVRGGE